MIFEGPGRDVKHIVASTFKAAANKGTALDCEQKISTVVFHEETVRSRKKRIRGGESYSVRGRLYFQSACCLKFQ